MEIAEIQVSYSNTNLEARKVTSSNDVYKVFLENWNLDLIELQEEFKILMMNRGNVVLGIYNMSKGGTSQTIVDAKLLFSVALKCNATALILAHNHPSGRLKPSTADLNLTKKLKTASETMDISLLDHLIITKDSFYSFADNGFM